MKAQLKHSNKPRLTKHETLRYDRQLWVQGFGLTGQKALKSARVAVVGMGGLGCPAATYLATSGVGHLTLIDPDTIELSNLHRQPLYREFELGESKVTIAKKRLQELNPAIEIEAIATAVTDKTAPSLLEQVDAILDCSDNFECRYAVNALAVRQRKLLISAGVVETRGLLFVYDANKAFMHNEIDRHNRKDKQGTEPPCYACLFPRADFIDTESMNCNLLGILPPIAGLMGAYQALELMQQLSGNNNRYKNNSSRLLLLDAAAADWKQIDLLGREAWCDLHAGNT